MRKAGLNPMLALKLGGASTPPGAMGQAPEISNIGTAYMQAAETKARTRSINQKTRYERPAQELDALKNQTALDVAKPLVKKGKSLKIAPELTPDFNNFLNSGKSLADYLRHRRKN